MNTRLAHEQNSHLAKKMRHSKSAKPYENLYLSVDEADIWFVIDGERIPGHKLILSAGSPWFKAMFTGSLPEQGDVNLSETATVAEFKEFLQFFYLHDIQLTMANIDGVLNLAKQSMVDDLFLECEQFLMDRMTIETMCHGYQLAILYDAKRLEQFCERAISINAMDIIKSGSFLTVNYGIVYRIVGMPTLLVWNEKCIFDACINWARAQTNCHHNQIPNDTAADGLRDHLQELLHQIRVESLTDLEFGSILHMHPNLFTMEEIQEMIFIRTHIKNFQPKWFKAQPRLYQRDLDQCQMLTCNRFISFETGWQEDVALKIKRFESTIFSSNQPVLLRGFLYGSRFGDIKIECIEKCDETLALPLMLRERIQKIAYDSEACDGQMSKAKFHVPIVIESNQRYELRLELQQPSGYKRTFLKSSVQIDQDITIQFYATDGETDANPVTHNIIQTLFFNSLNKWPTKLLLRERETNRTRMKRFLRQSGGIVFKCVDFFVFLPSLIM